VRKWLWNRYSFSHCLTRLYEPILCVSPSPGCASSEGNSLVATHQEFVISAEEATSIRRIDAVSRGPGYHLARRKLFNIGIRISGIKRKKCWMNNSGWSSACGPYVDWPVCRQILFRVKCEGKVAHILPCPINTSCTINFFYQLLLLLFNVEKPKKP
jgi:hypothetical protein